MHSNLLHVQFAPMSLFGAIPFVLLLECLGFVAPIVPGAESESEMHQPRNGIWRCWLWGGTATDTGFRKRCMFTRILTARNRILDRSGRNSRSHIHTWFRLRMVLVTEGKETSSNPDKFLILQVSRMNILQLHKVSWLPSNSCVEFLSLQSAYIVRDMIIHQLWRHDRKVTATLSAKENSWANNILFNVCQDWSPYQYSRTPWCRNWISPARVPKFGFKSVARSHQIHLNAICEYEHHKHQLTKQKE